jgi:formylglycine-generating enzyme required for sulfatase activity
MVCAAYGLLAGCSAILGIKAFPGDGGPGEGTPETGTTAMPNCAPGGPGLNNCGTNQESCCTSLGVPGGTYDRTYDSEADGGPSAEADPTTVSGLRVDKYLVTVGRFRQFVNAWAGGYTPPAASGKHAHLNGGRGLADSANVGSYEPGWASSDDANVAPTDANLGSCNMGDILSTWTPSPATQENLPIDCITWQEAYAFCIWDGGFLPSEAEWEYVAAGGNQQREYPWGSTDPGTDNLYAIYGALFVDAGMADCYYPSGSLAACTSAAVNLAPVGTATLGVALWGQLDMAGELFEWNLDWYANYVDPCTDCASLTGGSDRVNRGGLYYADATNLLSAARGNDPPTFRGNNIGFRCARAP